MKWNLHPFVFGLLVTVLAGRVMADRIELTEGSVVHGRLLAIEKGKLKVETAFAGSIQIAQDTVVAIITEDAVNIQLKTEAIAHGRFQSAATGLQFISGSGPFAMNPADIVTLWREGDDSPRERQNRELAEKAQRKWSYDASVAMNGRTGTKEKFRAAVGFKATLASSHDRLLLAVSTENAEDNGRKTADRMFGEVDYSVFNSKDYGWYVRTSLEEDNIKSIDLRSSTALGYSRKLIRKTTQDLEFRVGVSYLFENYASGKRFQSPGVDLTLLNTHTFAFAKLTNSLTYEPVFKDFSNYRLRHESALELPLKAATWKLKLGLTNEYVGKPQPGVEALDTTYFTSLILNWK